MHAFDLTGRVAIVTGGNGGIGLGMARGLIDAGASVVLSGRDATKGAAAVQALDDRAAFVAADVTLPQACEALVAAAESRFGRLDILVANAGMSIRKQPMEYDLAEWQQVLNVNLTSTFVTARAAYPALKRAGGGKIITVGSMMSIFGAAFAAAYAASKGGVVQLTKSLAVAWAPDNIQVNAVLPGWIDTALTRTAREQVDGLHEHVINRAAAARWGRPEDLAGIAVFLASPASDFVTGSAIPVDGGFSAKA